MIKEEITQNIVGQTFNGVKVEQVTDGTLATVGKPIYRYKLRGKTDWIRDAEEKVVMVESETPLFAGYQHRGVHAGTELISVRCGDPDDKRVWVIVDPIYAPKQIDRDPVTRRPIIVHDVVNRKTSGSGQNVFILSYDEFLELVNSRNEKDGGEEAITVTDDPPVDEREAQPFTDGETDFIRENYETMSDAELATYLEAEEKLVRDYRLKVLKLKKAPFGGKKA